MARGSYDIADAIRDVGENINQNVARYQALPPLQKGRARAGYGAALLALGVYAAAGRPGVAFAGLVPCVIWAAAVGLGGLWLYVGVTDARSARDAMSAVWSAVMLAIFASLAVTGAHWLDGSDLMFFVEGAFLAGVLACLVRVWLAVRGLPTGSLEQVRAQQAHGRARDATLSIGGEV